MRTKKLSSIIKKITELSIWENMPNGDFVWGLVPQMAEDPYVCVFVKNPEPLLKGRLMFFPKFEEFRDYIMVRRFQDYGVIMSLMELNHYGVSIPKDDKLPAEAFLCESGYRPLIMTDENAGIFSSLLYQAYGVLLRYEEDKDIFKKYMNENTLFARKEISDVNWVDGPLKIPNLKPYEEKISLKKDECDKAKKLPIIPDEAWEVDFALFPNFQTNDQKPRLLYVLAVINASTKEIMSSVKMSVDGKENALVRMWGAHAARLLAAIIKAGRVPGEIRVQSPRMMRFLRPLGMQLPFKIVQENKLPAIIDYFNNVIAKGG